MIALGINRYLFVCDLLIIFYWIFRFFRKPHVDWLSLALNEYLVFSCVCVAPHRTIVLEISLTHAFANVLGIEYGRLLMTEMVKFVLFITFSDCKQYILVISVVAMFSFLRIFWQNLIFLGWCGRTVKFLTAKNLKTMKTEIRYTFSNV